MLALAPIPKISADTTIRLQRVEIKEYPPCVATRTDKKRLAAERHRPPLDGNNLRRALPIPQREKRDVVACSFDALKWKTHRLLKCASLGQHADIDFAAMVRGDRVGKSKTAHNVG